MEKEVREAIAVQRDTLRRVKVELEELPEATFNKQVPKRISKPIAVESLPVASTNPEEKSKQLDVEEKRPVESQSASLTKASGQVDLSESRKKAPALKQPEAPRGGESINRKALESTNRGKSPNSRRFVKGILHPSPFKVFFAAVFAIAARLSFITFLGITLLVIFNKIEMVYLWGILIFPLFVFLNVVTSLQVRCRVCGMKEFVPSQARKHKHTHTFLWTGPIISTALHVILFRWFRCMFCGTAIRTKK